MEMRLEIVVLPVSDASRAKSFYVALGWRIDSDTTSEDLRVIQMTPPGSRCSIVFGVGVSSAAPGSAQGLMLSVTDIEAARADLRARGIDISEIFHDDGGVFTHADPLYRVPGLDSLRRNNTSFASFADPDGNGWLLQENTARIFSAADRVPHA
ncbi:VOC family protein [Leifsonia flava]|uniref:Glyoxalase n=1 Tax=Orlajensenia leifsoniae TaxID=2561933 RepID=A0A4Y9R6K3_9MICO|nr:VOC family protein [Leifsonia flava]TFW00180.1 glyoxalase [Leifsonia flava]